ncbi:hypothetical protein ACX3YD_30515 [Pseudomonas fluorescens group sp. PF-1]
MEIHVTLRRTGRILATPDPVRVFTGEPIIWVFESDVLNQPRISWLAYFLQQAPFLGSTQFSAVSRQHVHQYPGMTHLAATTPVVAQIAGDYKYGIRATATGTGVLLGDDDPLLIVLPR